MPLMSDVTGSLTLIMAQATVIFQAFNPYDVHYVLSLQRYYVMSHCRFLKLSRKMNSIGVLMSEFFWSSPLIWSKVLRNVTNSENFQNTDHRRWVNDERSVSMHTIPVDSEIVSDAESSLISV
jgi:hypothetical protein